MNRNYKLKKTISMKKFISELGDNFSEHMKKRLLELDFRCVLTRKSDPQKLDLKHVEHTKYDSKTKDDSSNKSQKEYTYAEFIVDDEGDLYFANTCTKEPTTMESTIIDKLYSTLDNTSVITREDCMAKKLDDNNIDYVVDSLLSECPDVSQEYLDVIKHMLSI
ncbi:hypothetical protein ACER0A_009180 [Haloimpatiens sp. FM7315]|uniref:hypothetical protein n=1 Tax=Haloimpatiens sp. FM7315 TaxID=3298609 RepID=UPI0035A35804